MPLFSSEFLKSPLHFLQKAVYRTIVSPHSPRAATNLCRFTRSAIASARLRRRSKQVSTSYSLLLLVNTHGNDSLFQKPSNRLFPSTILMIPILTGKRPLLGYSVSISCPHSENTSQRLTEDDSPYPEVRSAVANTDDTSIPCGTFRAWVMGMKWVFRTCSIEAHVQSIQVSYGQSLCPA